jgi:hypothetical protein
MGGWRKPHIEEFSNLCSTPNIIRMIIREWHITSTGKKGNPYKVISEKLKKRNDLDDRGINGRIILKWI